MRADDAFLTERRRHRLFSNGNVKLFCDQVGVDIAGHVLVPDKTKGYMEFKIGRGLQIKGKNPKGLESVSGITAWGTGQHAGTIGNSYGSMLHQVLNRGHQMKHHDPENIKRDHIIGSVVAMEYPNAPREGWKFRQNNEIDTGLPGGPVMEGGPQCCADPQIRAAAVVHKLAEGVPKILGEHLGGRHKWMVSQELDYSLLESGYLVANVGEANKGQKEICAMLVPEQEGFCGLRDTDYGYVPCMHAPDELLECYNPEKRRVDKTWGKLPVVLVNGGINGKNHFMGVGVVRYGAERDADIHTILAAHPDDFESLLEDETMELVAAFGKLADGLEAAFKK